MCLVLASKFAIICYAVMENQYEYSYLGIYILSWILKVAQVIYGLCSTLSDWICFIESCLRKIAQYASFYLRKYEVKYLKQNSVSMAQHFSKQDTNGLRLFERSLCEILGFISDFAISLFFNFLFIYFLFLSFANLMTIKKWTITSSKFARYF